MILFDHERIIVVVLGVAGALTGLAILFILGRK